MAIEEITGIISWLKGWFYDKTEITAFLNNKANQSDLNTTNGNITTLQSTVNGKVDKVTGKGLSTEDFTTALKDKLDGIESGANNITVDSALSSTSENPLQNKAINTALSGKAPTSHASSSSTYGLGTTSNYGHVKTINGLTQSSHINGTSLSAYQGKVLKDLVDAKQDSATAFSGSYNDLTNVPSSFTPASHNQASTTITESSALSNLGTSANATQHTINDAINTKIGQLVGSEIVTVVTEQTWSNTLYDHPSSSTMGSIYAIPKTGSGNDNFDLYITVQDGNDYYWEEIDYMDLSNLSISWSAVTGKPSTFTPSTHTQDTNTITGVISDSASNGYLNSSFNESSTQRDFNRAVDNKITYFMENFVETDDSRLTDARTPTSHSHGNLSNDGKIGTTANVPLITGTDGVVQAGSFGNSANTFCQGNDSRLSNSRTPTAHASSSTTYGVATTSNYGHTKIIDSLDKSTLTNGESLSAHQGYVLNQAIATKGAKTDDIDWSYNSNNFVNGIRLVPKSEDDTGTIEFYMKS